MFNGNKFKNPIGVHLLKPIFYELDEEGRPNAMYSLKDYDSEFEGHVYPSLHRLYVELEDPTEYEFARTYLDGWSHWKKLSTASFFKNYVSDMREELSVRLRAKGLAGIKQKAVSSDKDALQAQKYLANEGWVQKDEKASVGRPTKEKVIQEAEKLFKQSSEFEEDFNRIMKGMN